jgi:hypothetical protein
MRTARIAAVAAAVGLTILAAGCGGGDGSGGAPPAPASDPVAAVAPTPVPPAAAEGADDAVRLTAFGQFGVPRNSFKALVTDDASSGASGSATSEAGTTTPAPATPAQ